MLETIVFAQRQTADIGIIAGGAIPFGDYTKTDLLRSVNFDFGGFYRFNYNSRISLRINFLYGTVGAKGQINSNRYTYKKNLFDASALVEFNYLEYILGHESKRFSPYIFIGIGSMVFPNTQNNLEITPSIPIGLGAKYALTKKIEVGAEVSFRKSFSDKIDNLDNPYTALNLERVSTPWHNNDWVCYFGATFVYKIYLGSKPCPVYERLN